MSQEGEACSERDSPTLMCDGPFQDGKEKIRVVKAATVDKLVEHLAPYRTEIDVSYRTCFLATYRTFITTTRLIQLLKERSHTHTHTHTHYHSIVIIQ